MKKKTQAWRTHCQCSTEQNRAYFFTSSVRFSKAIGWFPDKCLHLIYLGILQKDILLGIFTADQDGQAVE